MNVQTKRLLINIYRSSTMGMHTIRTILSKFPNIQFKDDMVRQYDEYSKIADDARKNLIDAGVFPEDNGILSKAAFWGIVHVDSQNSINISKVSEIMINGGKTWIIDIKQNLNSCKYANEYAKRLAENFIETEETNIEKLKVYL